MSLSIPLSSTEKVTITATPDGLIDSIIQWTLISGTAVATPAADGFSCEFVNDAQDISVFQVSTTANGLPLSETVEILPSGTTETFATTLGLVAGTPVPR
jgi:hypothetical protein